MQMIKRVCFAGLLLALLGTLAASPAMAQAQDLIYTISRDGEHRGYLLGTVHSDDPRVLDFTDEFIIALEGSDRFAMELVPNQPTLSRLLEYMHYDDGSTLESRIGEERFSRVVAAAGRYHMGPDQLATMKVWAVMMTLSIPPPENGLFMDLSIALRAAGSGLEVVGLETLDEQLSFLEDMPSEQQILLLDQALEEFDKLDSHYEELLSAYLGKDLAALQALSDEQLSELPREVGEYFFSQGIEARNIRMCDRLLAQLESGTVFAAVGALHLPGDQGLVMLLRQAGFTVRPADFSPFRVPTASVREQ